jgi:acyl-CoA reductase-like NAD-dependent aldehyde dehydrogenase
MDSSTDAGTQTTQDTTDPAGAGADGATGAAVAAPKPGVLTSLDPATGDVVGEYPIAGRTEVEEAVARAREAAAWWAGLQAGDRKRHLLTWKRTLAQRADELAQVIRRETGKPLADAGLEVMLAVEHLDWAARHANRVLRPRKVRSGALAANHRATLGYEPLGVIGVIGPWNYPLFTPVGSIAYALAAGNAVVFKPSELTPGVGVWLADSWAEMLPHHPVLQTVVGFGETGSALCRSGVDKIAFTGSTGTAKKVMALCAESLTPVVIEGGGKDALIVAADADVEAAADAAIFGGLGNAGQTCVGVERVYVVESVAEQFIRAVRDRAQAVAPGGAEDSHYGPATLPRQLEIIERHIADALARGGRAVVGGRESVRPPFAEPVVLADVPEDSSAVTEETFGPTLVVNRVPDVDEAVRRSNATSLGLAASIFTKDRSAALDVVRRLRVGMVSVNSVIGFAAIPSLPFGGVGDSGFGRIHGADGLREFSRAKAVTEQRFKPPIDLMRMDRDPKALAMAWKVFRLRHGR